MLYGLDCLNPPTSAQGNEMWRLGWRFLGMYTGGPRAAAGHHGWPNESVGRLADLGFRFLPIYVGRTFPYDGVADFTYEQGLADGDDSNILAGAAGFNAAQVVVLDAEYGDWQNEPASFGEYLRGFVERSNGAGHPVCLYSDPETLNQYGNDMIDFKWGAAWQRGPFSTVPPYGRWDPALPPPWDAWQFGGGTVAGVSVDLNSLRDDFPLAEYTPPA